MSPGHINDIRLAASKMHGAERRAFTAEMTLRHCNGNPRKAETVFGWGRKTVEKGLGEKRTGIICHGGSQQTADEPAGRKEKRRQPKNCVVWPKHIRNRIRLSEALSHTPV